jgi:hypothetical protein
MKQSQTTKVAVLVTDFFKAAMNFWVSFSKKEFSSVAPTLILVAAIRNELSLVDFSVSLENEVNRLRRMNDRPNDFTADLTVYS